MSIVTRPNPMRYKQISTHVPVIEKAHPWHRLMQWLWSSPSEPLTARPGWVDLVIDPQQGRVPTLYATPYTPEIATALHRAKYGRDWPSAKALTRLAAGLACPDAWRKDKPVLVPVPPDPRRLAARGFHLPALLAQTLRQQWAIEACLGALRKTRHTTEQARRSRQARHQTDPQLFVVSARALGRRPDDFATILVDDVMTTGATLAATGRAIGAFGGRVVGAVVVAYVPDKTPHEPRDLGQANPDQGPWFGQIWERTEGIR